jgi:hypothetical protein
VSAITFADPRNGWLYDGALWATHDGGARWVRIGLKVQVSDVVVAGGWAYAAVPGPVASATAPGAPALLRSPVRRDDWQPVRALPALGASSYPSLLAASGSTVFAAQRSNTPAVWRSAGVAWQRLPSPCSFVTAFDASSSADLAALCPPTLAISTDAGAHARSVHVPTGMPATAQLGIPPGQTNVIVLASPGIANALTGAPKPDALYRSTDGGQHWTRTPVADRGAGFSDLQFVSPTVGWVVHGFPGAASDQLMRTTDAGLTFTPVRF